MTPESGRPARRLVLRGAPTSAGAYGPGQEQTPATFRRHGLLAALRDAGHLVEDDGDGPTARWQPDPLSPRAANADVVAEIAGDLRSRLADVFTAGDDVLVLGGDCTVELGTVGAAIADGSSVALVYVDLDADLHTPATGDGVLDWMGVAHIVDVPGAHPGLAGLHDRRPMLDPQAVRLVATANITDPEQRHIDDLGIHVEPLESVTAHLDEVLARTTAWARGYDRLLVHVDVDVLDYDRFPIAENTGRRGGLELDHLTRLLTGLCALPNWRALTVAEINPAHAPDEPTSFGRLIECLVESLSPRSGPGSNPPAPAR